MVIGFIELKLKMSCKKYVYWPAFTILERAILADGGERKSTTGSLI